MDIFTRLRRLSRIRLGSTLTVFSGLLLNLLLAMLELLGRGLTTPWSYVLPLAGVVSIFAGMVGFLISFETDKESFTETLRSYILPQHFGNLPVARTQFAYAIRELVDFYARQHEGGYLPVIEDVETEISVEVLPSEAENCSIYNIPMAPKGYSWQWLRFTTSSSWVLRPLEWGHETVFDPQDFLNEVFVVSYKTYIDLFSWRNPRRAVYLPIASPVYEDETLRRTLDCVRYIRARDKRGGDALVYHVSKWLGTGSKAKQISDPTPLLLEPLLGNATPERKQQIAEVAFPGLEKRPLLSKQVCEGIYQVYRCRRQPLPDLMYIHLPQETDSWWRFTSIGEYVLPAKVIRGTDILWDQQAYLILFGRATTVRRLTFRTRDDRLIFRQDRPPELLCYPYLTDPSGVGIDLVDPNTWIVEPGDKFWYPGDVVYFVWYDTLIDDLIN